MCIKTFFQIIKGYIGALKESSAITDGTRLLDKWSDWFVFGSYSFEKDIFLNKNSIIVDAERQEDIKFDGLFNEEFYLSIRVKGCINQAFSHYIGANNVKLPENAYIAKPNYAKYQPEVTIGYIDGKELTMNYHTDYAMGEWFWENQNFLITSTTYMNDDYENGEISFFINGDIITYKPEAGDILVFPSGSPLYAPDKNPYFHGVHKVRKGEKYLIRSYVKYPQKGNDIWYKNLEKYGAEKWSRISRDMVKNHNLLAFEHNHDKVQKTYGNRSVWQSPLVDFLYKRD